MKTLTSLFFIILFTNISIAQKLATGTLTEVKADGLHEIIVPNEIRSFSNSDLSDFRIYDATGNEVPYFIRQKNQSVTTSQFVAFDIISKKSVKDSITVLVVKNPKKTIHKLALQIANYAGSKNYNLLGSYNQKEWFGLVNNASLSGLQQSNETSILKTIRFPICSYSYLKVVFNDQNSLPINIINAGSSQYEITNETLQEVHFTSKKISEHKAKKTTNIQFSFKNNEIINQILFKISAPELYNRKATLYKIATKQVKGKPVTYKQTLTQFYLNSTHANSFDIPQIVEDNFFIEIENNDNIPLKIDDIYFYQDPLYIITSLKSDIKYTVKTGDKNLKKPQYDLAYFKSDISTRLPKTSITDIQLNNISKKEQEIDVFWKKPWFMWLCITLAGIVILYFTRSLVADMKKGK